MLYFPSRLFMEPNYAGPEIPQSRPASTMDTLQKLAVPIAIVIAGGMIAVSLYFVNSKPAAGAQPGVVQKEIRDVQKDDHILGNPNAKLVIVEYSDPECPFCKQFHETLHQVINEYGTDGKVAWVY